MKDRGDWMQTYTGLRFHPQDPQPDDFDLTDIAIGLGRERRFAGHTLVPYTVAQHSVLVWNAIVRDHPRDSKMRRTALLHDAPEAYLKDIPRPVKVALPDYRHLEACVYSALAKRFDLYDPIPLPVKIADERVLADEQWLMPDKLMWNLRQPGYGDVIEPVSESRARAAFCAALQEEGMLF